MPAPDLFDSAVAALLLLDSDGVVRRASAGWLPIFDWGGEQLVGSTLDAFVADEHAGRFAAALNNIARGAPSAIVRASFPRPRPEEPLRLAVRLQPWGDGVLASATERAAPATTAEPRLDAVANFVGDAWFVHDLEGRIVDANAWACQTLGYTREEMLALHVADIETTLERGRVDGVWNRMEVGRPRTVRGRQKTKDGHVFPVEVRLGLFEDPRGEVLMLALVRDITEREQREQQLRALNSRLEHANAELSTLNEGLEQKVAERTREAEETVTRLQATVANLADGLVATDASGCLRLSNPALSGLLGGEPVPLGAHADDALPAALARLITESMQEGITRTEELELPGSRSGAAVASPVLGEDSELQGCVAVVRDVTLEREIDRMKTDFIATVSHELRTPLTSVLGFVKLSRSKLESRVFPHVPAHDARGTRAVEQVAANLDIVVSEGQRLTALINDVLDISKMEAGRMEWSMGPVDVESLVTRAAASSANLFAEGVDFQLDMQPGLPTLLGDADRLLQVVLNLLSNAAKFTREGRVRLSASVMTDELRIEVQDSGAGIDPSEHGAIFEKFRQVGDTLTDRPTGTGLGLPICKQIVTAHRGTISVSSEVGRGATFRVSLPLGDDEPTTATGPLTALVRRIDDQSDRLADLRGRDILVVDDDPSLRELLRQQLTDRGFRVRLAEDGYAAIAAARQQRPDLVVLDVMMPKLSGFDVAAMLKADPATAAIPIIVLSVLQDAERGLRLGVDRYLAKPTDSDVLADEIERLLARVRSPRRVLVIDEEAPAASGVVRLLESTGYHVVGTVDGESALHEARRTQPDLIVVESMVEGREDLVRAIRLERDLEHVYVVQLVEPQD